MGVNGKKGPEFVFALQYFVCVCVRSVPVYLCGCDRVLTAVAEKCRASVCRERLLNRAVQGSHCAIGPQCTAAAINLGPEE